MLHCRLFVLVRAPWVILAYLSALASQVQATHYYMTKNGAGSKNGRSWADAYAYTSTSMQTVLNVTMRAGDTLYLEGADYGEVGTITINSSGTPSARKSLIGVDRGAGFPKLSGDSIKSYEAGYLAGGFSGASTTVDLKTGTAEESVMYANASTPKNPPKYLKPTLPWDGSGSNLDNQTFGLTKGYNSTRRGKLVQ
jgi:hypothetical protein